jgi:uncharacterized protein HemX
MDTAVLALIAILLGAGVGGGLLTTWTLHRRTFRLEFRLNELEDALLTLRNREKALKRWSKAEAQQTELEALLGSPQGKLETRKRRYDNDPLEVGESSF